MRDRWRDIYSDRGLLLVPYLFLGARGCQRLHPLQAETSLFGCVSLAQLLILGTLSKSPCVVLITWSSSGYTPFRPNCPDALSCLLITTWQLVKAHRVTRNKSKIHVICYITIQPSRLGLKNTPTASLQWGKTLPINESPGYDIKLFDGKLWGMQSTSSLPLFPGPLWPRVIAPDRILSMGQTELTFKLCVNKWLMLNWIGWNRTVWWFGLVWFYGVSTIVGY